MMSRNEKAENPGDLYITTTKTSSFFIVTKIQWPVSENDVVTFCTLVGETADSTLKVKQRSDC